jgi:hypothetical protein
VSGRYRIGTALGNEGIHVPACVGARNVSGTLTLPSPTTGETVEKLVVGDKIALIELLREELMNALSLDQGEGY